MRPRGRFHAVQEYGPHGLGPSYVLDYGRAQETPRLRPYDGRDAEGEWVRLRDGWWASADGRQMFTPRGDRIPASLMPQHHRIAAAATYSYLQLPPSTFPGVGHVTSGAGTLSSSTLNATYTFSSAGIGIGWRISLPEARTLSKVLLSLGTVVGSPSVVIEIRRNNTSTTPATSSTLIETITAAATGGPGWVVFTAAGSNSVGGHATDKFVWVLVGRNAVATSVVVNRANTTPYFRDQDAMARICNFTTTDGWATVSTNQQATGVVVLCFSDGTVFGNPINLAPASPTSDTNRKGLYFDSLVIAQFMYGCAFSLPGNTMDSMELRDAGAGIGADLLSGIVTYPQFTSGTVAGFIHAPVSVPGTPIRPVLMGAVNFNSPNKVAIGTVGTASITDLKNCLQGGPNNVRYSLSSGTTDWSNDDTNAVAWMSVLIDRQVAGTITVGHEQLGMVGRRYV